MSAPDPERVQRLFHEVAELPPAERQRVLAASGAEQTVVDEVLDLLGWDRSHLRPAVLADERLGAVGAEVVDRATADTDAGAGVVGTAIGPYHIQRIIGAGGMGVVFLARQEEPIQRQVALKLIKLGMDSRAVVARFERERQTLALMEHEGIAKVFDCGTSERGQPYFVMELVHGEPLDRFCDDHRLSVAERLRLMQQVCAAVQHAHHKGVVHRDLKPGNVLVSEGDGRPHVKVIDFGLAKALGPNLVEATLHTEAGMVAGTPEYMAPEQADTAAEDIDTRADVYSLGVMLHEVLVGELPHSRIDLRRAGLVEAMRILRAREPARPSTKLTALGDAAGARARARRTSVSALRRALRTDLDWVVLKAMDGDRDRRYETADALAKDLQRFLDHEPLIAGPPSAGYRARKLLRRYRGQAFAAALVLATAVAGAFVALDYAVEASRSAAANGDLARELRATVVDFEQLSGVVKYDQIVDREHDLYPGWPYKIDDLEHWLSECQSLLDTRPEIERALGNLRHAALPLTDEQRRADFESDARYPEWQLQESWLRSLRRAARIRSGEEELVEPELPEAVAALDAVALNKFAWARVGPNTADREVWGEEAIGLAAARLAVRRAVGKAGVGRSLITLGCAFLVNGRYDEAKEQWTAALAAAPERLRGDYERTFDNLSDSVDHAAERLRQCERSHAALTAELRQRRRTWTLPAKAESRRFLHDTLTELLGQLDALEADQVAGVRQRLSWARSVGPLTRAHPNASVTWEQVRAQVRDSEVYAGATIALDDDDVIGLVPLGANPATGLQEFYHLRSAWDGRSDPAEMPIPRHRPDGSIEVTAATGMVFVLLPGGEVTVGAQNADPAAPNFDADAHKDDVVFLVNLTPFFLARHEMTQEQWARLWTGAEALRHPSLYPPDHPILKRDPDPTAHPVEAVDWTMCAELLRQHGLALPTEVQWEYACRAGTSTPMFCELAELKSYANVADASAKPYAPPWPLEAWTDGHHAHAQVGSFLPNAFGFYDMLGNVLEWCADGFRIERQPRDGDGLDAEARDSSTRVDRGGSYSHLATLAKSAERQNLAPTARASSLGLRAARPLRPGRGAPASRR